MGRIGHIRKRNFIVVGVIIGVFTIPFLYLMMLQNSNEGIFPTILFQIIIYGIILHNAVKNNFTLMIVLVSIKILLSIIVLYLGWFPELNYGSSSWGYDPQRYYLYASELANNNFNISVLPSLNYKGIVYYYAILFKVFGCNPVIPMLINTLTTYISAVYIVKIIRHIYPHYKYFKDFNYIGLFILLPEIFWYDILSSRETICMSLVLIIVYHLLFLTYERKKLKKSNWIILFVSFSILGIIRTSFLFIPLILVLYIIVKRKSLKIILTIGILLVAIVITNLIGSTIGSSTSLADGFERVFNKVSMDELQNLQWSTNSIGLKLIGDTILEKILLLPVRIIVYIIAPLPQIAISVQNLSNGNWSEWQKLFTVLSSCGYVGAFPFFIASMLDTIIHKKTKNILYCWMPFLISAAAVAGGNIMIHERYRIVFIPYYVLVIITGIYAKTKYKVLGGLITIFIFTVGIILYTAIKM